MPQLIIAVGEAGTAGGWRMTLVSNATGGAQSAYSSDVGDLEVHFSNGDAPGEVHISAHHSITIPADPATNVGARLGETAAFELNVSEAAGAMTGTISGKGMGKGRHPVQLCIIIRRLRK